jgi:hypothetical protein
LLTAESGANREKFVVVVGGGDDDDDDDFVVAVAHSYVPTP